MLFVSLYWFLYIKIFCNVFRFIICHYHKLSIFTKRWEIYLISENVFIFFHFDYDIILLLILHAFESPRICPHLTFPYPHNYCIHNSPPIVLFYFMFKPKLDYTESCINRTFNIKSHFMKCFANLTLYMNGNPNSCLNKFSFWHVLKCTRKVWRQQSGNQKP